MPVAHPPDQRPEFMAKLGLLPPYSAEDVENAYVAKIRGIRPNESDDRMAFYEIQHAYEQAREYVKFHGDRRSWIARQMEEFLGVQSVIERLRQFGAEVETDAIDWLEKSIGDFAELTDSIVGIRLRGVANADEAILYMISQRQRMLGLRWIDLSGSVVSDASVRQLGVFRRLKELDVSRTPITWEALHVVNWLPELESVRVEGTGLQWLTRWRLARKLRRRQKMLAEMHGTHPTQLQW
jgi:hypothetical protein